MASPVLEQPATLTPGGRVLPFKPEKVVNEIDKRFAVPTVRTSGKPRKLSHRPNRILFGALTDPRVRLKRPISLRISRSKGAVIAYSADLQEFGHGITMSDALDDFSKGLSELFFALSEDDERLGSDLKRLRDTLSHYLEERTAR